MGKKNRKNRFNKKDAVRFFLLPGPEVDGKPTTIFRPADNHNSRLTPKQRQQAIKKLTGDDYDKIQINGKDFNQNQILAFVLEQIRGRKDLVFNEKAQDIQQQEVIDQQEQFARYAQDGNMQLDEEQDIEEYDQELIDSQELIQEEDWQDEQDIQQQQIDQVQLPIKSQKFEFKQQDFPQLEKQEVEIDGQKYQLTKMQQKLLNQVLPTDYEKIKIKGVNFQKYNEDGLKISDKNKYEKYFASQNRAIVDSYDCPAVHPKQYVDNDLENKQIKGQIKDIQDALDYDGEDAVYDELEDDFFAKLIQGNNIPEQSSAKEQKNKQKKKNQKKAPIMKKEIKQQKKINVKFAQQQQEITDQMLEEALNQFEKENGQLPISEELKSQYFNVAQVDKLKQYMGKDGELDWRLLNRKQKKQYMRQKKIKGFYEELRQREIQQKIQGKVNINVDDLHLKQYVRKIEYKDDHVMQQALKNDEQEQQSDSDGYQTISDDDDIISYKQKTSIIASNLSIIQQPSNKQKKKQQQVDNQQQEKDITKIKYVPQKRNRNETKQQRKQRKEKRKQMKKQNRQSKKEFMNQFQNQKKISMKKSQVNNALHKVNLIKIA